MYAWTLYEFVWNVWMMIVKANMLHKSWINTYLHKYKIRIYYRFTKPLNVPDSCLFVEIDGGN